MIEFTADCGHVIKVPKAKAGTIVQCAYCGREAEVPRPKDPDFLFEEVDLDELARTEGSSKPDSPEPVAEPIPEAEPPQSPRTLLAAGGTICGVALLIVVGYVIVKSASTAEPDGSATMPAVPASNLTGTPDDRVARHVPDSELDGPLVTPFDPGSGGDESTPSASEAAPATTDGEPHSASEQLLAAAGHLNAGGDPGEWQRYLAGGADHGVWRMASPASRIALIDTLSPDLAALLSTPIGNTMLHDDDLEVRLALLDTLVGSRAANGLGFIQQRLDMLLSDTRMIASERQEEESALERARRQLGTKKTERSRNPWDR